MNWRVQFRPDVEKDVAKAARWYNKKQDGLGREFVEEIIRVWDDLAENPLLNSRKHGTKNIRWRYPDRFPYRVIYEVVESEKVVTVAAVLHAARRDSLWRKRIKV